MKKLVMMVMMALAGSVCYAQSEKINGDSLGISQIPVDQCDSLVVGNVTDRYGMIYKGGKCGVYDVVHSVNVTEVEFDELGFSKRLKVESGNWVSYFYCVRNGIEGILGVIEETDDFMLIMSN